MNASANEVNSIDRAGGVETTQYDTFGNTVRRLSAGKHALALGKTADDKQRLDRLGIRRPATGERAELLSDGAPGGTGGAWSISSPPGMRSRAWPTA
ncbi:hypothetical protein [Streptomyces sp. MCL20-2]|uniref:hypothetical protein n=1 Tax=Streptomyces sp. MCL20-2 TaxID=2967219 RepID=UPI00296676BB|nr:hypothetical protein [Streptomyces sp. MCL20-2]